jgi:hypothetical protein
MRTADDLLAEISDELSRKISSAVGAFVSGSSELKVQSGFPFTLMYTDTPVVAGEATETTRKRSPIYRIDSDAKKIDFYLNNPTTTNGDYPVRMRCDLKSRQFYFLKVVAKVTSVCKTTPPSGPPFNTPGYRTCYNEDVTTESVTVERHTSIPEQKSPVSTNPAGEEEEGMGWDPYGNEAPYGSPSGTYTIYLPLVCLNFNKDLPVSWVGDQASRNEYEQKNPMWASLIFSQMGGDSSKLWWSNGSPYPAYVVTGAGDVAAPSVALAYPAYLDPEDSRYVLSSL